jgi:hypothetical protein
MRGERCRRRSNWFDAPFAKPTLEEAEFRWLLLAKARARAMAGGEVIAQFALRGYPRYALDYIDAETAAEAARRGLW